MGEKSELLELGVKLGCECARAYERKWEADGCRGMQAYERYKQYMLGLGIAKLWWPQRKRLYFFIYEPEWESNPWLDYSWVKIYSTVTISNTLQWLTLSFPLWIYNLYFWHWWVPKKNISCTLCWSIQAWEPLQPHNQIHLLVSPQSFLSIPLPLNPFSAIATTASSTFIIPHSHPTQASHPAEDDVCQSHILQ